MHAGGVFGPAITNYRRLQLRTVTVLFVLSLQNLRAPHWTGYNLKVKVKVTLVQVLRLCTGRTAHRVSRGIALPFHDHGTRRW